MDNADVLLQSSLSPLTLVAEEASSGIPGASFILYNHVQAFSSRKSSLSITGGTISSSSSPMYLPPSSLPAANLTTTNTTSYTMATSLLPNYNVSIIFLVTSRSPQHHLSIFRKLGISATVYTPSFSSQGTSKKKEIPSSSSGASLDESPKNIMNASTTIMTNQTLVTIIDLHDPFHIVDGSSHLHPEALYESLTTVCQETYTSSSSSSSSSNFQHCLPDTVKFSLVIEDIGSLIMYSSSLQQAQKTLKYLLHFPLPSSVLPNNQQFTSSPSVWHTITARYMTDTDWNISTVPHSMVHAQSLYDWLITTEAYTLIQLLPLPTGYSRDVHGRLQIKPLKSFTGSNSTTTMNSTVPLVSQSLLIRITTDGKVRGIGNIQFTAMDNGKDANKDDDRKSSKNSLKKLTGTGLDNEREYNDRQRPPLPDPDQVEGDYD